ncbi:MAG: hypothetical protein CVV44_08875 [Spirochaetae bacterium HGW-Spirochaetae-1]|jgi:hypothetical protein|nr:MAG: hypothetical protein CVV44_08875 [Spirochaetae bacterium HGW-Spirochaetae-1]
MKKRGTRLTGELLAVVIIMTLFAVGLWSLLRDEEKTVQWCYVITCEDLCREALVPVTAVYTNVQGPTILSVDFHGVKTDGTYCGFISSADSTQRVSGSGTSSFNIFTGTRKDLSRIIIVVSLSRNGLWNNHTHSAVTKSIPLKDCGYEKGTAASVHYGLFDNEPAQEKNMKMNEKANSILKIINTVLIFFITGLACIKTVYPASLTGQERQFNKNYWRFIAAFMILVGLLTIPPLRLMLTDAVREVSRANDWYSGRRYLQRIITVIIVSATMGVVGLIINRIREKHYSYLIIFSGTTGLFLVTMLRLLSYHNIDAFFNYPVMGLRLWLIIDCVAFFLIIAGIIMQGTGKIHAHNE